MSDLNFEDFDEDLDDVFSEDEEERSARMAAFNKKVQRNMKIILSRKPSTEKRVEAALWLGNSGEPTAIPALAKVYRGEKNKKVKSAAAYALGQFKALDKAIVREPGEMFGEAAAREENADVLQRLTDIMMNNQPKKRAGSSTMILTVVLTLLLVGLLAGNYVLMNQDDTVVDTDSTALDTLISLRTYARDLQVGAETLLPQVNLLMAGDPVDCDLEMTTPNAYRVADSVAADYPDAVGYAERLNVARENFQSGLLVYERACSEDADAPDELSVMQASTDLQTTIAAAESVNVEIVTTENEVRMVMATETARESETPVPTEQTLVEETAEPVTSTPAVSPNDIAQLVREMFAITSEVSSRDGALTLLTGYWNDIERAGRTEGCDLPQPTIPEDYGSIPQRVSDAEPNLAEAREQLNLGLALLRQGWDLFEQACASGTLSQQVETGTVIAQTASTAVSNANRLLTGLR